MRTEIDYYGGDSECVHKPRLQNEVTWMFWRNDDIVETVTVGHEVCSYCGAVRVVIEGEAHEQKKKKEEATTDSKNGSATKTP